MRYTVSKRHNPLFTSFFDDFFTKDFFEAKAKPTVVRPAVNIRESDKEFILEVAAPGMKKEHFNVALDESRLNITAKMEEAQGETQSNYTRREFRVMDFSRSFTLPEQGIDEAGIKASYAEGILSVTLPKLQEEVKEKETKLIEIS